MPTNRKQTLLVFSDQAMQKLQDEAEQSVPPSSVQNVVRKIVDEYFGLKPEKDPVVRGRPRKEC